MKERDRYLFTKIKSNALKRVRELGKLPISNKILSSDKIQGLPPIVGDGPSVLLLGSMPSVQSITHGQYYAHPQNAFWPLVSELFQFPLGKEYSENTEALKTKGVAVWDVLAACERKGSLDSAIISGTQVLNPIDQLLAKLPTIKVIGLNGSAAFSLFNKHQLPLLDEDVYKIVKLPSTSPAYAAMNRQQKQQVWARLLEMD